jgi:sec-independent protein translocase protein TatC
MTEEMPFWNHVEELRWRLFKSLLAIVLGALITHYFSDALLAKLIEPSTILNFPLNLQVLKVTSMFMVKVGMALMGGIILSLPVIFYQIWCFISPAFEKKYNFPVMFIVVFSTLFFAIGLIFGYNILVPFSLEFFTSMTSTTVSINYNFTLEGYLIYIMWLLFACGLIFQLPVITILGAKIGILTPPFLRHYRKYAIVSFLIIGALLTPPDPLSQLLIFCPLVFLYEFSIFICWVITKE